jgi:predicted Zn-dependent protease
MFIWRGRWTRRRLVCAGLVLLLLGALAYLAEWYLRAERHLTAAEQALERHDLEQARHHLEAYLTMRPGQTRARFLAAQTARRLHRDTEAAEHLRLCQQQGWDQEAIDLERMLAALQRGDADAEPILWARVQSDDPEVLTILEVLIQYYLDTYRLHRTLECLNRYLERQPDDLHALLGRGFVWERFLSFTDALKDYRQAVKYHPGSTGARLRLARTALLVETPQEALEQFQHLHAQHPDWPAVRLGLAQCRRRLGQNEEARRLLDGLLAERPDDADVLGERAQLALDEGKLAPAETWLRQAVRRAPHDRKVNYSLYRCLLEQGKKEQAEEYRALVERIDVNLKRLERLTKAVLKAPDDANLRCQVGLIFLENGQEQEGVRWLTQALRLDPRCQPAQHALAEHARRSAQKP